MIQDSGNRREFKSGAVRDIDSSKGRCDLLPLSTVGDYLSRVTQNSELEKLFVNLSSFIYSGINRFAYLAIDNFCAMRNWTPCTSILEVSIHFAEGAEKYGERNWEKGIPVHSYIDSAVRHVLKYVDNWTDEPHDRAFIWNILCALWTIEQYSELNDLPFNETDADSKYTKRKHTESNETKPTDDKAATAGSAVCTASQAQTTTAIVTNSKAVATLNSKPDAAVRTFGQYTWDDSTK